MSSARSRRTYFRVSPARLRTAVLTLTVLAFGVCASAAAAAPQVNITSQGEAPKSLPANVHYFKTIQSAVDASVSGDWVLIAPGIYTEAVKVSAAHPVSKSADEPQHRGPRRPKQSGQRHRDLKANNVSVDNLTMSNSTRVKAVKTAAATESGGTAAMAPAKSERTAGSAAT
jgi:pectin methylesterase-like acyl-CoA thioesterase